MSGSNPFDDLADDVDDDQDTGRDEEERERESKTRPASASDTRSGSNASNMEGEGSVDASSRSAESPNESTIEGPALSNSSPPFPYSEAEQQQMYVKHGLWDEFEDLQFDAELELRRTFEVRNVEQREIDTAVVRLVLDQLTPREIAEMVIQMRGYDPTKLD